MTEFSEISPDHPGIPEHRAAICRGEMVDDLGFREAVEVVLNLEENLGTGPREIVLEAALQVQLDRLMNSC